MVGACNPSPGVKTHNQPSKYGVPCDCRAIARYARCALAWQRVLLLLLVGLLRPLRLSRIARMLDSGKRMGRRRGCDAIASQDGLREALALGETAYCEALLGVRAKIQAKLWRCPHHS